MQLLGLNRDELQAALREMGEGAFRGRQLAEWIYHHGAASFDEMTTLSRDLRARLNQGHSLEFPDVAARYPSADGSLKLLLRLKDGEQIETVRLPYPNRVSVCVSSQAGCAMACAFCATGLGGFRRNLSAAEIIAQPLLALRMANGELRIEQPSQSTIRTPQAPITHVVFMGMGEPMLNLDNVLEAIHLMHDEMSIPFRHITVSTVGILRGIERLAQEKIPLTLAVSLHAPDDALRHKLIPTSRKTSVAEIVGAARGYVQQTGRRVSFEYVVLGGINDGVEHAKQLARLCRSWPCHVNLIPWNAVPEAGLEGSSFQSPLPGALREFRRVLEDAGVAVTQRVQRGADVAAACGQLRAVSLT